MRLYVLARCVTASRRQRQKPRVAIRVLSAKAIRELFILDNATLHLVVVDVSAN